MKTKAKVTTHERMATIRRDDGTLDRVALSQLTLIKLGAKSKVERRFKFNASRVQDLLNAHDEIVEKVRSDVLRSTVVLLHAMMEDALRNLLAWKVPSAPLQTLQRFFSDRDGKIERSKSQNLLVIVGKQ